MAIVINGSGTITGVSVGGLPDGSVDSDTLATGIDATKLADGTVTSTELQYINSLSSNAQTQISAVGGKIVQVVNVTDSSVASGTTILPDDDTIPQNTEGDEWQTLAITPTSATNKLFIEVVLFHQSSVSATTITAALFQDSTAGALGAGSIRTSVALRNTLNFTHYMTSGTTSSTTFKVRIGATDAGTTTTGGHSGTTRVLGGILSNSITISEIEV